MSQMQTLGAAERGEGRLALILNLVAISGCIAPAVLQRLDEGAP